VKSNQIKPKRGRNIEKEKCSESSRSTEPTIDITRPQLQREGSKRKRKTVIDQERGTPEIQSSTVVSIQETASLDHIAAIEQSSSRKRKSKLAMKDKETVSDTRNPLDMKTRPKARKPKQCVITQRIYDSTKSSDRLVLDAISEEQSPPEVSLSKPQRRAKLVADNDDM
jgi:hypothetical protein